MPYMKLLFLTLSFCLSGILRAQDFEGHAREIADSLFNIKYADTTQPEPDMYAWSRVFDSVVYREVITYLDNNLDKGNFSWPFWYLQRDWGRPPSDTGIHYPSQTQQYLMKDKYHISMSGVSNGCIWQNAFVIHDSLMMVAIRAKYGQDFFKRVWIEANQLDSSGFGLQPPFIENQDSTIPILLREIAAITPYSKDEQVYIRINFNHAKIKEAVWCIPSFSGLNLDIRNYRNSIETLTPLISSLPWHSTMLNGKPLDEATVVLDLNRKTLTFENP